MNLLFLFKDLLYLYEFLIIFHENWNLILLLLIDYIYLSSKSFLLYFAHFSN